MTDSMNLSDLLKKFNLMKFIILAAMSHVSVSFEMPEYVADTDGIGTLRLLEAVRITRFRKEN